MARAEVHALEREWKKHKADCPKCAHRRERCRAGEQVYDQLRYAREELAAQRGLDRQPFPGQAALF